VNPRSISFRLVLWYVGLLTVIFSVLCIFLYLDLRRSLVSDLRRAQVRRSHQIANTLLENVQSTGEAFVARRAEDSFEPEANGRFMRITRDTGAVMYISGRPSNGDFNPEEIPAAPVSSDPEASRTIKLKGGKSMIVDAFRYEAPDKSIFLVEAGESLDFPEAILEHLLVLLAVGLPLAVVIVAGGGYLLLRRALAPVEQITRAAERITQHNLSERLPVAQTGDELQGLSVALNRMITRLDDAFRNSQRFVADASHDLRTPVTILRGELEGLADDALLEPELRERIASLLDEVLHLGKIVEQLFTLSRLDAGEMQTEWTTFDLAELCRTTAEQMSLLAVDKSITLACPSAGIVRVRGNRVRLKQLIVNLLDNAIKYTGNGGAVDLRVNVINGSAVLEVVDRGIGIPQEALPYIFERFYRVDPARSSDSEGAGLGLSIVKAICIAHGAAIEATSALGRGSTFRVTIPLAKS